MSDLTFEYLELTLPLKVKGEILYDTLIEVGLKFFDEILSFPEARFVPSKEVEFLGSHIQFFLREFKEGEKVNEFRVDIQTWGENKAGATPICDFHWLDLEEEKKHPHGEHWKWVPHHSGEYPYLRQRFIEFREALFTELAK